MTLPFAVIDTGEYKPIVLIGLAEEGLIGFDAFGGLDFWAFEPGDIDAIVNYSPSAVFTGVRATWSAAVEERAAANVGRRRMPRFAAKGQAFPVLPEGVLSGFPVAARTIRKHRDVVPSIDTIRVSAIFAVSTVRTRIEQAEISYRCFGELYEKRSRTMPPASELRSCFQGLQNSKSAMFEAVAEYAPTIQQGIQMGYRDRELRNLLALDSELPNGLGLAKLSFTLALLGHDCICLDGRLLGTMFDKRQRVRFERDVGKEDGKVSERALLTYEAAEDAFLANNPHYDPNDPLGRARAQWTAWEAVGGKGATHSVWLDLLPEEEN